jgi:flagellar protein FlbD
LIELTRLNGRPLVVNCDLIKYVESAPDTMLTLVTGEKIVVREACAEVVERAIAFRTLLLRQSSSSATAQHTAANASAQGASAAHRVISLPKAAADQSDQ